MTAPERDPFAASESAPSLSFKDKPEGTVLTIVADGPATSVQQRVFGTDGELAYWPSKNGQPGNPKMAAVINGATPDGKPCSLWAPIPSDLCSKVADAQKAIRPDYRIKAGDRILVKLVKREPSSKGNPKNVHAVKIEPAPDAPAPDAFGGSAFDDAPPF